MRFIVDTGPLVALLDGGDNRHDDIRTRLRTVPPPLLTCEAVLAEAFFLLKRARGGRLALTDLLMRGGLSIHYSMHRDEQSIAALMKKYVDVPMTIADACLVRMCELEKRAKLLTFDSDFQIYRLRNRKPIPLA